MTLKPAEMGEAISLGISVLLVLSLLAYLIVALFVRSDNPYVSIRPEVQGAVAQPDGGYIIPVTIRNMGEKTVPYASVTITLPGMEKEIEVEYLPRQSTRDIYLSVDQPYTQDQISAKTSYYRLD